MERKTILYLFVVVIIFCLVTSGIYLALISSFGLQESDGSATGGLSTPSSTPTPIAGVSSINFTRWQPSTNGKNTIIIAYPENNSVIKTSNMSLQIYAASKSTLWSINSIWYTADWLEGGPRHGFSTENLFTDNIFVTINFHDIPDGNHTFAAYLNVHDYSKANVTVCFTIKTD